MIFKAFLVALVAFYGRVEQGWLGQQMIARTNWSLVRVSFCFHIILRAY